MACNSMVCVFYKAKSTLGRANIVDVSPCYMRDFLRKFIVIAFLTAIKENSGFDAVTAIILLGFCKMC